MFLFFSIFHYFSHFSENKTAPAIQERPPVQYYVKRRYFASSQPQRAVAAK